MPAKAHTVTHAHPLSAPTSTALLHSIHTHTWPQAPTGPHALAALQSIEREPRIAKLTPLLLSSLQGYVHHVPRHAKHIPRAPRFHNHCCAVWGPSYSCWPLHLSLGRAVVHIPRHSPTCTAVSLKSVVAPKPHVAVAGHKRTNRSQPGSRQSSSMRLACLTLQAVHASPAAGMCVYLHSTCVQYRHASCPQSAHSMCRIQTPGLHMASNRFNRCTACTQIDYVTLPRAVTVTPSPSRWLIQSTKGCAAWLQEAQGM